MSDARRFVATSTSVAGAPDIEFHFDGDTCRASLADARLYAEMRGDGGIDVRIVDETGEVLADIVVNERSHRDATENLLDIGSALLWSHWRHCMATLGADIAEDR